jgi:hypothetical protein
MPRLSHNSYLGYLKLKLKAEGTGAKYIMKSFMIQLFIFCCCVRILKSAMHQQIWRNEKRVRSYSRNA